MKKQKKDEQLDDLFRAYIDDKQAPPERVTLRAKQLLADERERAKQEVRAAEPQAVTASGEATSDNTVGGSNRRLINIALALIFASVVLMCIILMLPHGNKNNGPSRFMENRTPLNMSQLKAVCVSPDPNNTAADSGCVAVAKNATNIKYEKFFIADTDGSDSVGNGNIHEASREDGNVGNTYIGSSSDAVVYYSEYITDDGCPVSMFVETGPYYLTELEFYKSLDKAVTVNKHTVYVSYNKKENISYCYFENAGAGYNIKIGTSDKAKVKKILADIVPD